MSFQGFNDDRQVCVAVQKGNLDEVNALLAAGAEWRACRIAVSPLFQIGMTQAERQRLSH
jgi:hypothetical protein